MVRGRPEPDPGVVARVADVALSLPGAYEEDAWTGVRWRVRQRTFAHVAALPHVDVVERLGHTDARTVSVVSLRSAAEERAALQAVGPPRYFFPTWTEDAVTVVIDDDTDWDEIRELVTESYRLLAPQRLVRELDS